MHGRSKSIECGVVFKWSWTTTTGTPRQGVGDILAQFVLGQRPGRNGSGLCDIMANIGAQKDPSNVCRETECAEVISRARTNKDQLSAWKPIALEAADGNAAREVDFANYAVLGSTFQGG